MPSHPQAAKVHGNSDAYLAEHGEDLGEVLARTIAGLREAWAAGCPVVVYNAAFDLSMLSALEPTFTVDGPVIDPMVLDKAVDPFRKGARKLVPTANLYGVAFSEDDAHDSSADALAAGFLARELVTRVLPADHRSPADVNREYSGIDYTFAEAAGDVDLLMDLQERVRRSSMDHLRGYFDSIGKPHDGCDGGWPVQDSTVAARQAAAQ
jgi:DNA polymerase III epsilon subunit-like protein